MSALRMLFFESMTSERKEGIVWGLARQGWHVKHLGAPQLSTHALTFGHTLLDMRLGDVFPAII